MHGFRVVPPFMWPFEDSEDWPSVFFSLAELNTTRHNCWVRSLSAAKFFLRMCPLPEQGKPCQNAPTAPTAPTESSHPPNRLGAHPLSLTARLSARLVTALIHARSSEVLSKGKGAVAGQCALYTVHDACSIFCRVEAAPCRFVPICHAGLIPYFMDIVNHRLFHLN